MRKDEQVRLTRVINPTPPFDFALSSHIFTDGDPRIAQYYDGAYRKVLRTGDKLMLATVTSTGSVETPQLRVTFTSDRSLTNRDVAAARAVISSVFNVRLDVAEFYLAIHDDPVMIGLARQLRGLKNPETATVFEALFDSIVEQQISLSVARVLQHRVIKTFGDVLLVDGNQYYAFPTPEQLAVSSLDSLRRCGLSFRKAEYITQIAQRISTREVDLEKLRLSPDTQEILDHLCALRGVGMWTAELTALRGLNRLDVIPADDLGLRRWIAHYYCNNRLITSTQARDVAQRWGNWKGLAGYYLIIAGLLKIASTAKT
ncbi:MAG: DNA-3-methyladenine glycosylase family protein [Halobacteriota archaeon]|jgi:DNA-3-methyladenine glycosylase II